jgi:hypothetical protein
MLEVIVERSAMSILKLPLKSICESYPPQPGTAWKQVTICARSARVIFVAL